MIREIVVYDGDCGICEWSAKWVRRHSTGIDTVDHTDYGLKHLSSVWFMADGRKYEGAKAVSAILKRSRLKTARWIGIIIDIPGCRLMAQGVYFMVAKNRRRLSKLFGLKVCTLQNR